MIDHIKRIINYTSNLPKYTSSISISNEIPINNGLIIFSSDRNNEAHSNFYRLHNTNSLGEHQELFLDSVYNDLEPRVSFELDRVIFSRNDLTNGTGASVDINGINFEQNLIYQYKTGVPTPINETKIRPVFLPNKEKILFFANGTQARNELVLYTQSSDTDAYLYSNHQYQFFPDISSDGLKVISVGWDGYNSLYSIWEGSIVPASDPIAKLYETSNEIIYPRYNKAMTKIAFSEKIDGVFQIKIMDVDGQNVETITNSLTDCEFQCFSPDDSSMLFAYIIDTKWQLHTMTITGQSIVNISNNAFNDYYADWVLIP